MSNPTGHINGLSSNMITPHNKHRYSLTFKHVIVIRKVSSFLWKPIAKPPEVFRCAIIHKSRQHAIDIIIQWQADHPKLALHCEYRIRTRAIPVWKQEEEAWIGC